MNNEWFTLKRNATLHSVVPVSKSIVINLKELTGTSFKKHICVFRDGEQLSWNYEVSGMNKVARFMLNKTKIDNFNENILNKWIESSNELEKIIAEIEKKNLKNLIDEELINIYSKLIEHFETQSAWGTLSDFLSSGLILKEITKHLRKLNPKDKNIDSLLNSVMSSLYKSPYTKEQKSFLKIAKEFSKNKDVTKKLLAHCNKYWYQQNDYKISSKLNVDDYNEKLKTYIKETPDPKEEYSKFINNIRDIKTSKRRIVQLATDKKLDYLIKLLKMVDVHIYLWDLKKVMMQKTFYYFDQILNEIADRKGLEFNEIKWLSPVEINTFFETQDLNLIKENIHKRKRLCVLEVTEKGYQIFTDQEAEKIIETVEGDTNLSQQDTQVITGRVGNTGIVRGIVRKIYEPRLNEKFNKGEILVTGMTTPDFIPYMKKAKAIITDEGGITCHAAIVSRELNIPCVIGTKNATKILNNGDLIEVDANIGIIKIIK